MYTQREIQTHKYTQTRDKQIQIYVYVFTDILNQDSTLFPSNFNLYYNINFFPVL